MFMVISYFFVVILGRGNEGRKWDGKVFVGWGGFFGFNC